MGVDPAAHLARATWQTAPKTPSRADALTRVGTTLSGRYRLVRLIGMGGMGAVYAGVHRNGYSVAIKLLHERLSSDPEIERLFRREALLANKVAHPGVVSVTDDDVSEDGCVFLVMPLLEGETLRRRWEHRDRQLPLDEVIAVAHAVLEVLHAAHAAKIVHRDVKPDNIFIEHNGTVRMLDFGIARFYETNDPASATRSGRAIGTPAFMAPEQALGRLREVDGRTDLWALGATMYALLTGQFVHEAETGSEVIVHAATRPAQPLRSVVPDIPAPIAEVVDRALSFARADRWLDAAAMDEALLAAYERAFGRPVSALPPLTHRMTSQELDDVHSVLTQAPLVDMPAGGISRGAGLRDAATQLDPREPSVTSAPTLPPASARAALGTAQDPTSTTTAVESTREAPPESAAHTTGPARRAPASRRARVARWVAVATAAVVGIGGIGVYRHNVRVRAETAATSSGAAAAPPASTVDPKAMAHFNAGVQAWKDASLHVAQQEFEKACEIAPEFPDPHLFLLVINPWPTTSSHEHFRMAFQNRARLKPELAELLQALEPSTSTTPNVNDAANRITAVYRTHPEDFVISFSFADLQIRIGRLRESVNACESILSREPSLAAGWYLKAVSLVLDNKEPEARVAYARCLNASPLSSSCLSNLITLDMFDGDCATAEKSARSFVAALPGTPISLFRLAQTLLGQGAPVEAVRATLERGWNSAPEADRQGLRLRYEFLLSLYLGKFEDALNRAKARQALLASVVDESPRHDAAQELIETMIETGATADAANCAREYSAQRDAWRRASYFDFSLFPWTVQYRTGTLGRAAFIQHRDNWLHDQLSRSPLVADRSLRWIMAFAEPVVTESDAHDAIAHLSEYLPMLDPLTRDPRHDDAIGFTLMNADRVDEAVPYLERAAHSCYTLEEPLATTVANLHLGQAYERRREIAGACVSYERILTRWGRSPLSATVKVARTRYAALACASLKH